MAFPFTTTNTIAGRAASNSASVTGEIFDMKTVSLTVVLVAGASVLCQGSSLPCPFPVAFEPVPETKCAAFIGRGGNYQFAIEADGFHILLPKAESGASESLARNRGSSLCFELIVANHDA